MKQKCNKCNGVGWYRLNAGMLPIKCSRCQGTGQMNRQSKAEKRRRRVERRLAAVGCPVTSE